MVKYGVRGGLVQKGGIMGKKKIGILVLIMCLCFPVFIFADTNIPKELKINQLMKNKANQPALEWIKDETDYVKKNSAVSNVSEIQLIKVGNINWYFIEYEVQMGQPGVYKMKQCYTWKNDKDPQLLEISFASKKDLFNSFEDNIIAYLSNIKLEDYFTEGTTIEELERKSKPAVEEDIIGEWEMIWQLNKGVIPADDPFVAPYWMFYFSGNNGMVSMGLTYPFDGIAATTWKLAKQDLQTTYRLTEPGVFLIKNKDTTQYYVGMALITEDLTGSVKPGAPKLKKGDLYLFYSNDNGVYLVRYLRRVVSK